MSQAYLPVYLITAHLQNTHIPNHTWSNLHLLYPSRCVSAELSPSLCNCTTRRGFWSVSQKGSDSLILLSPLHIYESEIYLCFLFPVFCSVNFHMLQYFFDVCVCLKWKSYNVWHYALISMEIGCSRVLRMRWEFQRPQYLQVGIYQAAFWYRTFMHMQTPRSLGCLIHAASSFFLQNIGRWNFGIRLSSKKINVSWND